MRKLLRRGPGAILATLLFFAAAARAQETNSLSWDTNANRVTADIQSVDLLRLLGGINKVTGWQIYLEENTTHKASVKFKDLPPGDALRLLLGKLNFALVPQTNSRSRLYVFRTSMGNATQLVQPADLNPGSKARTGAIPNELVILLKPGAKIENLGCLSGAKVTGRIDAINVYRLQFENEAAARTAHDCLAKNPDVAAVESNFVVERPEPAQALTSLASPEFNLKEKDPSGNCRLIIGLIDTGVGSLGKEKDKFFLPSISVAGDCQAQSQLTHGTAMAETILQSLQASAGGSTSVKILPVDVYGCNQTSSTFDIAKGIAEAAKLGANFMNLSLGSPGDSAMLHALIQAANREGAVFFSAAGNQPVTTPVFPAAYSEVIAVTAGNRQGEIADYANRGNFVDIMAPGTSIVPYEGQSYAVSGTSTATAYASGLAAGMADAGRNCPDQIVSTIRGKLGVNLNR